MSTEPLIAKYAPLLIGTHYEFVEATGIVVKGKLIPFNKETEHVCARGKFDETYYSTNVPKYVGKYIREYVEGSGDGRIGIYVFDNNGKEERRYSIAIHLFRPVPAP
jgi:hypothetical protein